MPTSEFRKRRLIADFVHFVTNVKMATKKHYIIPKAEFKPDDLYPKHTYHVNMGQKRLDRYLIRRRPRNTHGRQRCA